MKKNYIKIEKLNKKLQNQFDEFKKQYNVLICENDFLSCKVKELNSKFEYYRTLCDNLIIENSRLRDIVDRLNVDLPF